MKIRQGFVSNSSSSSFVLIYRPATLEEIDDEHVKIIGCGLNEGTDYFRPDEETRKYLKENPETIDGYDLELVYEYLAISEYRELTKEDFLKIFEGVDRVTFEAYTFDYCASDTFEYFSENYLGERGKW
jgi:hypothetical protein